MVTKCDYSSVAHTVSCAANDIKIETMLILYGSCMYYIKIHTTFTSYFVYLVS